MDDEKYFCFDGDRMLGSTRYYTNDKAKCSDDLHYSNETEAWMEENALFVEKASNPQNVPQARPIENLLFRHRKFMREAGRPVHSRS